MTAVLPSAHPVSVYLTARIDHRIDRRGAAALVRRFRQQTQPGAVLSGYFGRAIFDAILAQEDCAGVRIYHALHDDGRPTFVLVGVDVNANDLWGGELGEEMWPCPPYCCPPGCSELRAALASRPVEHRISLEEGALLTARFRQRAAEGAMLSGCFDRSIFDAILAQDSCAGIRVCNAIHEHGQHTFVLVGVDGSANDMWGSEIGEESWPCPPWCSTMNPLNS